MPTGIFSHLEWPPPADPAAAERLREQFGAGRGQPPAALLRSLGGNSPYLAELALRERPTMALLARDGPDAAVALAMAAIARLPPTAPRARIAAGLRQAKRVVALATAIADIGGLWTLERVTAALSDLAEAALRLSVAHLLRAGHDSGELRLPYPADPARDSGFTVLGMGKLGARELNYSSDVDLILLHDPQSGVYHGDGVGAFFTRLARGAGRADGGARRRRLRVPHRPAAAAGPGGDAAQHRRCRRPSPITRAWARTGNGRPC